jgi:N-succinyldiaminopimelate aminotransferase
MSATGESYFRPETPIGALEAAKALGRANFKNLIAFTSLFQTQQHAGP